MKTPLPAEAVRAQLRLVLRELRRIGSRRKTEGADPVGLQHELVEETRQWLRVKPLDERAAYVTVLGTFWESQRNLKDLLIRYRPMSGVDTSERIRMTARRVGLEVPSSSGNYGETKQQRDS